MQKGETYGPIALANRYDGIDLAGNACRFLIMDDLPQGTTNYDGFRANVAGSTVVNSLLAQRIEQGIGRGTRGGADYCVIMLIGPRLVGWVGQRKNLDFLTASTRVQLKMGQEVSETVREAQEVRETILQCLRRDEDWVAYHASELAEAARAAAVDELGLKVAARERKAFGYQRLGQYERALATLELLMADEALAPDRERRGWIAATAARIAYQIDDESKGLELQTLAFMANNNHSPPKRRPQYTVRPTPSKQSQAIIKRLQEYDRKVGLIADFNVAVSGLVPEASANRYEESLAELGAFLGFEAERPERVHGVGPDVLWRTNGEFDFVIEAKSEKEGHNPLYKKDHAQLLEAENWFKQAYPDRCAVRVSALPEAVAEQKATPVGSFAFRLDDISVMVGALRGVLSDMVGASGDTGVLEESCETALRREHLTPRMIRERFMRPFGRASYSGK